MGLPAQTYKLDFGPMGLVRCVLLHIMTTSMFFNAVQFKDIFDINSVADYYPTHYILKRNQHGVYNHRPIRHSTPPPKQRALHPINPHHPQRTRSSRRGGRVQLLQRSWRWQWPSSNLCRQARNVRATIRGGDESCARHPRRGREVYLG